MMEPRQRQYYRAPVRRRGLIHLQGKSFHCDVINISRGGVLCATPLALPIKLKDCAKLLFSLPEYPDFSYLDKKLIRLMSQSSLMGNIFNLDVEYRWGAKDKGLIGLRFKDENKNLHGAIDDYCELMTKNLAFFLGLFDRNFADEKELDPMVLAKVLGYSHGNSLSHVRGQALHDYQSLKQL